MKKLFSLSIFSTLLFMSCASSHEAGGKAASITGEWNIIEAKGISTAEGESPAFINFDGKGALNGNTSVNNFFGQYTFAYPKLELSNMGMTRMMGPHMEIEDAITDALNNTASIKIEGDTATVYNKDGNALMKLARKQ